MTQNLDMRYKQQDIFDISKKGLVDFHAEGKDYLAYNNLNLSIFVGDYCNANCDFCVAQLRYFHDGVEFIKPAIKDENQYFDRLRYALDKVKHLNPSVSLTGGEPTLDPKLPKIIEILKENNVRKRTITTNGSGLLNKIANTDETILDRLIDYELEHINISRAHYDEGKNDELMKFNNPKFSNVLLSEVIDIAKSNGIRPRLSCILAESGVNSVGEMIKYMDWAEKMGVDNVVFRQLMEYDQTCVKPGRIPDFCNQNKIELIPIWEKLDNDERFDFVHQVLGYYYYVEVFNYKNTAMVSEMADLKKIESEKERASKLLEKPVIYEMVFHPNGNLCGSWREWKEIILG